LISYQGVVREMLNLYSFVRIEIIFIYTYSLELYMDDVKDIRRALEQKAMILKQLEGVYKTSTSINQKQRVLKEIRAIKGVIKDLQRRYESVGIKLQDEGEEAQGVTMASILSRISIKPLKKNYRDREMDTVVSYMNFFESNYLPILSEYYVKLDYSHSGKRDIFYPRFMEIMHMLKQYDYEEGSTSGAKGPFDWSSRSKARSVIRKGRQRYLFALDSFFKDLRNFLKILIGDGGVDGSILLNPYDRICLDDFEDSRTLNNYTVIESLHEIYTFAEEFIRFLGMPEI